MIDLFWDELVLNLEPCSICGGSLDVTDVGGNTPIQNAPILECCGCGNNFKVGFKNPGEENNAPQ